MSKIRNLIISNKHRDSQSLEEENMGWRWINKWISRGMWGRMLVSGIRNLFPQHSVDGFHPLFIIISHDLFNCISFPH